MFQRCGQEGWLSQARQAAEASRKSLFPVGNIDRILPILFLRRRWRAIKTVGSAWKGNDEEEEEENRDKGLMEPLQRWPSKQINNISSKMGRRPL